ncbi:hypothetical protein C4D60_Mb01t14880 [Musa balbisiana]|uniref:Uncharacterized protein n=1 Tax=Musa balbisiana TaxID=52838 RepID=A0A4S8JPR1_MUSBA|nr:hypothetical protein C4D60_Mb01t14880 [Musa balbisiana]
MKPKLEDSYHHLFLPLLCFRGGGFFPPFLFDRCFATRFSGFFFTSRTCLFSALFPTIVRQHYLKQMPSCPDYLVQNHPHCQVLKQQQKCKEGSFKNDESGKSTRLIDFRTRNIDWNEDYYKLKLNICHHIFLKNFTTNILHGFASNNHGKN